MHNLLARLKPGAQRKTHLLLAACLWSIVGIFLMSRGLYWLWLERLSFLVVPGLLFGSLKSIFILDKTAKKSINRILLLKDGTCLGAVYAKTTWLLVAVMMGTGVLLKNSSLPTGVLGTLYITIGWALFFSSRHAWKIWRKK